MHNFQANFGAPGRLSSDHFTSQFLLLIKQTCENELFRTLFGEKLEPPLKQGRTFKGRSNKFHKVFGFPADLPIKLCQKLPPKTRWLDMTNRVKVVVVPPSG